MTLALGIHIPFVPAFSAPTPKAGAICAKQGLTQNYSGKKYTCVKSGKKLVWDKGVVIKKAAPPPTPSSSIPTPTPTPQVTPTPELSPSASPTPIASSSPASTPSPIPSPSPTKDEFNGLLCSKEFEILRNASGEYWCLKDSNGILRFAKNSTPTKSSGTEYRQKISEVFYEPPSQASQNIELCKINQVHYQQGQLKSGFRAPVPSYRSEGLVNWVLVPIDFS